MATFEAKADLFTMRSPGPGVRDASRPAPLLPRSAAAIPTAALPVRGGQFSEIELLTHLLVRGPIGLDASEAGALAGRLLVRFGDLRRVLSADGVDVAAIAGAPAALDLQVSYNLAVRALQGPLREREVLSSWELLRAYLLARLSGRSREAFHVLYLDGGNRLIADERVGEGTVDHAPVYPREVVRLAILYGAQACVLVHNHPSGSETPSRADLEITRAVVAAGKVLGVTVHDHVLVAGDQLVSFRGKGLM